MNVKKEIEKPWCTYSFGLGLAGIGKIEEEYFNHLLIIYGEDQMYAPECWDPKFIKRFDSLDEVVEYYIKNRPEVDIRCRQSSIHEVREQARRNFPSYYKDKNNLLSPTN